MTAGYGNSFGAYPMKSVRCCLPFSGRRKDMMRSEWPVCDVSSLESM